MDKKRSLLKSIAEECENLTMPSGMSIQEEGIWVILLSCAMTLAILLADAGAGELIAKFLLMH